MFYIDIAYNILNVCNLISSVVEQGVNKMKKTKSITLRVNDHIYTWLLSLASEKEWTLAHLVCHIIYFYYDLQQLPSDKEAK